MRPLFAGATVCAVLAVCLTATNVAAEQAGNSPPFTRKAPSLCVGGGFVAMVPWGFSQPLVVIRISSKGIEAPQTFPTTGYYVGGMQCAGSYIELLVQQKGSDHHSILPLRVQSASFEVEPREELLESIAPSRPTPRDVERKMERFGGIGRTAWTAVGDWTVEVPWVDNPGRVYFVHFVHTEAIVRGSGVSTRIVVTLLEETYSRRIIRSVPLIRVKSFESAD